MRPGQPYWSRLMRTGGARVQRSSDGGTSIRRGW
jgi:hypothetical protein